MAKRPGGSLLVGLALWLALSTCTSADCPPSADVVIHQLGVQTVASLKSGCTQRFAVDPAAWNDTVCAATAATDSSWLRVELWDVAQAGQPQHSLLSGTPRANPLLSVAYGTQPSTSLNSTGQVQVSPSTAATDSAAIVQQLPYQDVQLLASSAPAAPAGGDAQWLVTVQNEPPTTQTLQYLLRVSCNASYQCPAPLLDAAGTAPLAECSGHGSCLEGAAATAAGLPASPPAGCACQAGWGDVGCSTAVTPLSSDAQVDANITSGYWMYYELQLPPDQSTLVVEMNRSRGDPVLLRKPAAAGFQAGGLPSVQDYGNYSDSTSFRERLDRHQLVMLYPQPGLYYVGVFNNDLYLQEPAELQLTARWAPAGAAPLCPWNCSDNGRCLAGSICRCNPGFTGPYCDGTEAELALKQPVQGVLDPGQWAYYTLELAAVDQMWQQNGIELDFVANGGHPVLLAKQGAYPTLLDNDFIFRSEDSIIGEQIFRVSPGDLAAGVYVFAVFNMDYFRHQTFLYEMEVLEVGGGGVSMTPYFSIIIGVALSVIFCVAFSCWTRHRRRHRRRRGDFLTLQMGSRRHRTQRGVPQEVLDTLPCHEFKASELAASVLAAEATAAETPASGVLVSAVTFGSRPVTAPDVAANECSVCLAEYEEGELVRTLVNCSHMFHQKCIDQWLAQHSTCCICRVSVVPPHMQRQQPAAADPQALRINADAAGGESELGLNLAADLEPAVAAHDSGPASLPSDAEHGSSPPQSRQQAGDSAPLGAWISAAAVRCLQGMRTWRLWTPHEREQRRDQVSTFTSDAA